ncbi:MAG TPA: OmpA family protein, partial [Bacteroidales bacterium]|nr:OmpA family protein [Bacteroidales bacterium]
MKRTITFTVLIAALFFLLPDVNAQVKVDVNEKVNEEADRRANRKTEQAIDYGFDKVEEGITGIFKKKDKDKKESGKSKEAVSEKGKNETTSGSKEKSQKEKAAGTSQTQVSLTWNKYDFVPGDKIIFEDNQEGEQNGEFPSRWDLAGGGGVENAALMKEHSDISFSVEGHTDSDGDDASNQSLSERLAQAVVAELTKMGIAAARLSSKGWGESKSVGPNNTSEGKASNRRV